MLDRNPSDAAIIDTSEDWKGLDLIRARPTQAQRQSERSRLVVAQMRRQGKFHPNAGMKSTHDAIVSLCLIGPRHSRANK